MISSLTDFSFLRPMWLLVLLVLPLFAWWWRRHRTEHNPWRESVDAHLLPQLIEGDQDGRRIYPMRWVMTGLVIAIVAMSGPSWRTLPQPLWQDRSPLVIAVDLSMSTLADDVPPSRLLQARNKIGRILQLRGGGQIGLVAFADDAYTVSPLTDDPDNIALFLDALAPDVMPKEGNRIDRAIEESVRLLKRAGYPRGDILLISGQADGSPRSAAIAAAASGFRVSVLGLGSERGAKYRKTDGSVVDARLDVDALRATASAGRGNYAMLTLSDDDLQALGVLRADELGAINVQGKRGVLALDDGYWLLPLLLLLALFAFRRGVLAAVLVCLWLPWQEVSAADRTLWHREDQHQHARMERGVDAYRRGDYASAEREWSGLPGADAAYNSGNALAQQGRYREAIAEYDRALKIDPRMEDALFNKRAVEAAMKRKPPPPPNSQSQKNQDQKKQNQQNQNQQSQNQQSQNQQNQNQQNQNQQNQNQQNPSQRQTQPSQPEKQPSTSQASQSAQDKSERERQAQLEAQRQADATQRARMQQAIEQKSVQKTGRENDAERAVATANGKPQSREVVIANEAALRRVPDEPGGLLRAKFKLEQQRRRREGR